MPTKYEYNDTGAVSYQEVAGEGDNWWCQTFTPQITHYITKVKLFLFTNEVAPPPCIVEGTPIYTPQGMIPIEKLKEHSPVYCFDFIEGSIKVGQAGLVRQTKVASFLKIYTTGSYIQTTREHPFYTIGKGWQKAKGLETGDWLQICCGKEQIIGIEPIIESKLVYDPAIELYHNYFVGDSLFLVHNKPYFDGADPSSDVVAGIQNTTGDDSHPDGADLTSATFGRAELTTDEASEWKEIELSKYRVNKGTTYAIVLRMPDAVEDEVVNWWYSGGEEDLYPRGVAGISGDAGVTWDMTAAGAEADFLFEEWGDPIVAHHHPTIPNEPNMGRILSGMGSLKVPKV